MTVRELIDELCAIDEDILDYEVGFIGTAQLGDSIRISVRHKGVVVQEHADVDAKMLWLRAKT